MRRLLFGLGGSVFLVVVGFVVTAEAQTCQRLTCDSAQHCKNQQTSTGGKCCCNVECQGGQGGVECTCNTWCDYGCIGPCPSCTLCTFLMAGDTPQFPVTLSMHTRLTEEHLLTAQVVNILTAKQTVPMVTGVSEGVSNVGWNADYRYKVRIRTGPRAILDYVFEPHNGVVPPKHVRVTVDEFGNAQLLELTTEEVSEVMVLAAQTCASSKVPAAAIE